MDVRQGRIPPNDKEAERAVLGSVLLDKDRLIEISEHITEEDFYYHSHKVIFRAMIALSEKNSPIDSVTLSEELEKEKLLEDAGGILEITLLTEAVPTSAHAEHYAKIVANKAFLRRLIQATSDATQFAYESGQEEDDIVSTIESMIFGVTEKKNRAGFQRIKDVITETLSKIEKNATTNDAVTGLATGFRDFDLTTTGLHPGQLMILAARPAMGKTAFALNIAQNVGTKSDTTVALFSLEMQATDLVQRMICAEGRVDSTNLRSGNLSDEEWENIIIASGALSRSSIYLDDSPGIKVNEIRSKCRKLSQEQGNLGLIVIDYLQLIESSSRESRQQQISEISRQLKKLAMELEVPVIALSQLSRGVESREDKRPELSDLRESGSIEQDADIVAFLYRDAYYKKSTDEEENDDDNPLAQDITEVILKKNRSGATKTVKVIFKGEYNRFSNIAPEYIEESFG